MIKKRSKFILSLALVIFFGIKGFCSDSLKVYMLGYFKDEVFKVYYDSLIYTIDVKDSRKVGSAGSGFVQGFTFKIPLPDSSNRFSYVGENTLNMVIMRKHKYGLYFRDTKVYVKMEGLDYLILWRDFRQRDKYPLFHYWTCKPPDYPISEKFWEKDNNNWSDGVEVTTNKKGRIYVLEAIENNRLYPRW